MSVGREEVQRIAALARIRLDEEAAGRLDTELTGILAHVDTLMEVDVTGVEGGLTLPPPLPDSEEGVPGAAESRGEVPDRLAPGSPAAQAPEWSDGFFLVPRLPALDGGQAEAGDGDGGGTGHEGAEGSGKGGAP